MEEQNQQQETEQESIVGPIYIGFWARFSASLIDTLVLVLILWPLMFWIYGQGIFTGEATADGLVSILLNYLMPAAFVLIFWLYKSATPGKIWLNMKIVDATTLAKPSAGQLLLRYVGYYLSIIPLFLGFIWVGIDKRKQGFHDKIANTLVVYSH